jgi:Fic family protein
MARQWHAGVMQGLRADDPKYVGAFRGERGVEGIGARVGSNVGAHSTHVAEELRRFEEVLQALVSKLDEDLPVGKELDSKEQADVISLCAWAHAEWVRIHPFVNGNGRTARLWANFLATRYGLPPFVRLRPRPDDGYEEAGAKAMQGEWKPTAVAFVRLWNRFWDEHRN